MISNKIMSDRQLRMTIPLQYYQHRIILATGCFDIIHMGHVKLFDMVNERYRGMCLWVGLNSDRAVKELKGDDRPIHDFQSRATVIAAIEVVDRVFEIDDVRVAEAIRLVRPAVWVKGGDYTMETLDKSEVAAANECQADICLFPTVGKYSTTNILRKLNEPSRTT